MIIQNSISLMPVSNPVSLYIGILVILVLIIFISMFIINISIKRQIRKDLSHSESNLKAIFNNATVAIILINKSNNLVRANDMTYNLFGYNQKVQPYFSALDIIDENYHELTKTKIMSIIQGESAFERIEVIFITSGGLKNWGYLSLSPIFNDLGGIDTVIGIIIDINERKIAEENLKQSKEQFFLFMDYIPAIVFIKDENSRLLYANRNMKEFFMLDDDALGKDPADLFQPDIAEIVINNDQKALQKGFYEILETFKDKNGEDHIFHTYKFIIKQPDQTTFLGGIARDLTTNINAEIKLSESEDRFRKMADNIQDGICIVENKHIVYVNQRFCEIFGYLEEVLLHSDIEDYLPAGENAKIADIIIDARDTNLSFDESEFWLERSSSQKICVHNRYTVNYRNQNNITIYIITTDITERKTLENEFQRASKLDTVGVLAGGIAHDFNNILMAILGNLSLAKTYIEPRNEGFSLLSDAEKASMRAKDLTQQLLTFAKGGAPVKKTTSVSEIIKDTADFALRGTNVVINYNFATDLWNVEIDEGQISQVINNLVINAQQAMPEGGIINIKAENIISQEKDPIPDKNEKYIKISIEDHGTGIRQDHIEKIFDPFFTTKQKGSGLGLATSYSIVKKHDGYLSVHSHLGSGTIFFIYLPISEKEIEKEENRFSPVTGQGTVLIMEDDETVLKVAQNMLQRLGYKTLAARDGQEAIAIYKNKLNSDLKIDAIIMDLTIPGGMGGEEAIKILRAIDPAIKAIVSSGYSNNEVMANYKDHGFDGVIVKPYRIDELSSIINDIITQ